MTKVWVPVPGGDSLNVGQACISRAGGRAIALIRLEDGLHALDNTCPHAGGPLGQGEVEGALIVCPWHGRAFDIHTGICDGYADRVTVFQVVERPEGACIEIEDKSTDSIT
jgi:nitrite reductase/ring-hydroxylating ferredoxin subunit